MPKATYTDSTHQSVIRLIFQHEKKRHACYLTQSTRVRARLLPNSAPPPFKSHVIGKAFILNKNEGHNKKVENKVSGRVKTQVYFFMRTLAYAVVRTALESILNLTPTCTQTFNACALRQIAIPLPA